MQFRILLGREAGGGTAAGKTTGGSWEKQKEVRGSVIKRWEEAMKTDLE